MAECHARRAGEKIAEKKAEGNVKKLDQLVDQLKGEIESKDTVNPLSKRVSLAMLPRILTSKVNCLHDQLLIVINISFKKTTTQNKNPTKLLETCDQTSEVCFYL